MARKFVWVEAQIYPGIAPQMPLLIVKRIFTFWIAGSGTSFSNGPTIFSAKLTKVPWPGYIIYGIVKCG